MTPQVIFKVHNQHIKRTDEFRIVARSVNYLHAKFEFETDEWSGITKTALFKFQDKTWSVILDDDGNCLVPWEWTADIGCHTVSLIGGALITVDEAICHIYPAGYTDDIEESLEPTETVYEQLILHFDEKYNAVLDYKDIAEEAASSAKESEANAKESEINAAESESSAEEYADQAITAAAQAIDAYEKAEQIAIGSGFIYFEIDENGHLIELRTENLDEGINFHLNAGHLEVTYSD